MKLALTVLCIFFAGTAFATDKVEYVGEPGNQPDIGDCDFSGWKSYTGSGGGFPDNTFEGGVFGPLNVPDDGDAITDVGIELNIVHSWVGDLIVTVVKDDDGTAGYTPGDTRVDLLCRADLVGCNGPGDCCGCSDDLIGGGYLFSDSGFGFMSEPCEGFGTVSPGCYTPAPESVSSLADFAGPKDVDFYLVVTDGAGGDTGFVSSWTIWTLNGATATEQATWSSVKSNF